MKLSFTKEEIADIILNHLIKNGHQPTGYYNVLCDGNYLEYMSFEVK